MNRLLVICGPTATGKTSLGIKLAKKFNGEIVSADSRQVYQGMDIGTGKDIPKNSKLKAKNSKLPARIAYAKAFRAWQLKAQNYKIGYYLIKRIPVWLLDIVEPDYQFSVADYVKWANLVIKDIWKREGLPILVGGTGLYIKAVVVGIETMGIRADWELRKKLSNCQIVKLSNLLKKLDPKRWKRMNESDRKNPRRLIRAIEVAYSDRKLATLKTLKRIENTEKDILMIGLKAPYKILYQRIDKRVDERVKQGIIEEISALIKGGYNWENSVLGQTLGYKEWREYFQNQKPFSKQSEETSDISRVKTKNQKLREEIIQRWKYDEHGYARRQMTWFKKDKRISWFDISKKGWENDLMSFLRKQES